MAQVRQNQEIIAQYVYDGGDKRIEKTEWIEDLQDYQTKIYVYSGQHIIYEKNITTDQEATYVYGPVGRLAKSTSGLRDYYHNDHLGSVRLKTDESGNSISTVSYTPFGEDTVEGEEAQYTYNGKERDLTGLYYYGARYYDPETGRFISRDIVPGQSINPQTQNSYTYVLNNPLKYRDPDGCEQAGALTNGGSSGYPSTDSLGGPMSWSWAPQNIGKVSPGNPMCVLAMIAFCTLGVGGLGAEAAAASGTEISLDAIVEFLISHLSWSAIKTIIKIAVTIITLAASAHYIAVLILEDSDGKKYIDVVLRDDFGNPIGSVLIDAETGEFLKGERWVDGKHQVWIHVPREGDFGGHWEDDLDGDGIPSSIDDNDNDSEVGDVDPDKP